MSHHSLLGRRKFPRRRFFQQVGVLFEGKYSMGHGLEIGEKGMLLRTVAPLKTGSQIVLSFMVPEGDFIICRGEFRYEVPKGTEELSKFGILFTNIEFDQRRLIRDFISKKEESDSPREKGSTEKNKRAGG